MLVDYYPKVIKDIREMREICNAEQPEIDAINGEVDRLLANRFISKADKHGIERFEKELGIIPTDGQSIEDRRIAVLIKAVRKKLGFNDIINLIRGYSEKIELIPDYDKDELNVITGEGETESIKAIYDTLDEIIALNISIYLSVKKSSHITTGVVWQDDEIFSLKEAAV